MRLALMLSVLQQGAAAWVVGLIASLLMVVPVFSSIQIGRWSDRVGHRKPAGLGLLFIVVGGVLAATHRLPVMAVAAVLIGTGHAMVQVAVMNAIGRAGAGNTARSFSVLSLGFSVSGFMGPVVTGLAIDHAGVAVAFGLLCVPPALGLMLIALDKRVELPAKTTPEHQPQGGLWLDEKLRPVLVVTALLTVCWDLFTFVMPVHGAHLGLSATAIGALAGCFASGSFLVRVVLPWVAARWGERRILVVALTGATVCYAGFPLAPGFVGLMAVAFVLGAFLGSGQPMAMSLLHRSAPAHRTGEAMGLRTSIISLSQATLPLVFGVLGAWWGSGSVFWLVAVLVGGGVLYVRRRLVS